MVIIDDLHGISLPRPKHDGKDGFVSLTAWLRLVLCERLVPLCGSAVARFDSFSQVNIQSQYQIKKSQTSPDRISY